MTRTDIFAEARQRYTVFDAWRMLHLPGEPKPACRSPFRNDNTPSFSIHHEGRAWTDHATGKGGDVIEFVRQAFGGSNYRAVRDWFGERLGIDLHDHYPVTPPPKGTTVQEPPKSIQWPSGPDDGDQALWIEFSRKKGFTFPAVWVMVKAGILRFVRVDGVQCFVVTDDDHRAAEIRRMDGLPFGASKAFRLRGVDKRWLPGAAMIRTAKQDTAVLVCEGATDLLAAFDLYTRYRKAGGQTTWCPVAILGASCKAIALECANLIRGRRVRMVPDADHAGDQMCDHWTEVFRRLGCTVDIVCLPRGTDLTDKFKSIEPQSLFSTQ